MESLPKILPLKQAFVRIPGKDRRGRQRVSWGTHQTERKTSFSPGLGILYSRDVLCKALCTMNYKDAERTEECGQRRKESIILGGSNAREYMHHAPHIPWVLPPGFKLITLCALLPPILVMERRAHWLAVHLEKSRTVMESHGLH